MRHASGRGGARVLALAVVCAVTAGCMRPVGPVGARPAAERGLRFDARAAARVGAARGFFQIPKGGQPGTTSPSRPTLDEMGVSTGLEPVLEASVRWGRHGVHATLAWLFLDGDATLDEPLVSHEDSYAAGTAVRSDSSLLAHALTYRYAFDVPMDGGTLTVAPGVGVHLFRFDYVMDGSNGARSDRAVTRMSPVVEAALEWRPGGCMRWTGLLRATPDDLLGFNRPTTAIEANARLHLDLWASGGVFLEAGWQSFEYRDRQPVPNHVDVEFAPFFGLGGEFRF